MKNKLLIFIKNPEKGKVKTRLAKTIGDDQALAVYLQLLAYTKALTLQVDASRHLYYSNKITTDNWSTANFHKHVQEGNNLGDRMLHAFQQQITTTNSTKVVIIGSDCAELTKEIIDQAFEKLDTYDVVFGPANDGGYYLLGMRKLLPYLFEDKPWSQSNLLDISMQSVEEHGDSYCKLELLSDLDNEEDWNAVKYRLTKF